MQLGKLADPLEPRINKLHSPDKMFCVDLVFYQTSPRALRTRSQIASDI